ncbi:MAG: PKD domain-containing protein [Bacteroidia bacterium]|nr:PKD domain-containing protein [Bacteroidia bacterium]
MKPFSSKLILVFAPILFGGGNFLFAHNPPAAATSHLSFTENKGQWENNILFRTDFSGGRLFLEKNNFTYVFYHPDDIENLHPHDGKVTTQIRLHAVKVELAGGTNSATTGGREEETYHKNFFIGNDQSRWASDVKDFSEVFYSNIYNGIDLKVYSKDNELKYDYLVHAGSDAGQIRLKYSGADKMYVKYGLLYMQLSVGTIVEMRPYAYQQINNETIPVECEYFLKGNEVSFRLKEYNAAFPLVIDPTLVFSSFTGSSADNWGMTATNDAAGNLLTGGIVQGAGYPVTVGAYQAFYAGGGTGGDPTFPCDMAFAKFNTTGNLLLYATYLGGSNNESPFSIIVDQSGNLAIYGRTYSANFPVTPGAYDVTYNGGADIVVCKLSPTGNALLASTFVGGSGDEGVNITATFTSQPSLKYNYGDDGRGEIVVDAANNFYIASNSRSLNFPTTAGAFQTAFAGGTQDGVVFRINNSLSTLMWSSYIGGNSDDAAYSCYVDASNDIYVTGGTSSANFPATAGTLHPAYQGGIADGFIAHISGNGNAILEATFIGTTVYDQCYFVQLDLSGNVYVCGQTMGTYPVTAGTYSNLNGKQFIHKLNPNLSSTFYSTVFGSGSANPNISLTAFLVDTCENVYLSGWGRCINFNTYNANATGMPVTANAYQPNTFGGCDLYFIVFSRDALSLLYATFFGGPNTNEHVDGGTSRFDKGGTIYQSVCAGCPGNSNFPTTVGAWSNTNNSPNCNNGVIKMSFGLINIVSSFSPTPLSGCAPFTTTFTNNSSNAGGYLWDFGDGSPQDTSYQPTHTYNNPGSYIVMLVAINNVACNVSDTSFVTVTVTPPPPINPVIQYNSSGACDTLLVNFTAQYSAGQVFIWDFGDAATGTGVNVSHTYTSSGSYIVTLIINDTICINADTATVTITVIPPPPLNINILPNTTLSCDTLYATFNATPINGCVYTWDFGDASTGSGNPVQHFYTGTGSYTVILIVTDTICNATGTDTVVVIVPPPGTINVSINSNTVKYCDSLVATLQAVANFGSIYSWNFGDSFSGNGMNVSHTYTIPGTYTITLIVSDPVCQLSDTAYQTIIFQPQLISGLVTDSAIVSCPPLTVNLSGISNLSGSTFQWLINNVPISNNSSLTHTFNNGGTYNIMLIISNVSSCNLSDTAAYSITVFNKPVAAFTYESKLIYFADEIIHFYDQSIGASQWFWNFADTTFSNLQNPIHDYKFAGIYPVCLMVTNTTNCPDEVCHDVPITETIYVPNVFTPNEDHTNEFFRVYYSGILELEVSIFDRWGEMIYSWNGLDGFWDGTYKGKPAKQDVYVYYIKAKGFWEPDIVKIGRVTLLR